MSKSWSQLHKAIVLYDAQPFEERGQALAKIHALARRRGALTAVTSRSNTALHLACAQNRPELVILLLSLGACPRARNAAFETPLHHAVAHGCTAIIKEMTAAGGDIDAKDGTGCTPLHWAFERNVDAETVKALLAAGALPSISDHKGDTVLHFAAREGSLPAVRILLEAGANPSARNWSGLTPFHTACLVGQLEIIQFFLATPGVKEWLTPTPDHNLTPLHMAARSSSASVWDCLFSEVPHLCKTEDTIGRTPMHVAIQSDNCYVVEALLKVHLSSEEPEDRDLRNRALEYLNGRMVQQVAG